MGDVPDEKKPKDPWPTGRGGGYAPGLWTSLGDFDAGPEHLYGDEDDEGGPALHYDDTDEYDEYLDNEGDD